MPLWGKDGPVQADDRLRDALSPEEEEGHLPWASRENAVLQEAMSKGGSDAARWEGHLPETDNVMEGTQGTMESGEWWKGDRLDTNREAKREAAETASWQTSEVPTTGSSELGGQPGHAAHR